MQQIGFGGSCHWCTEAIFRSLKGVYKVEQGWISSYGENSVPSEAVIVHFNPAGINLEMLIDVHLHTHSCTSVHTMRGKYRSAVYTFDDEQLQFAKQAIKDLQADFNEPIITEVLPFQIFRLNDENYLDYYYKDPAKLFCQNIVSPKLKILLSKFACQLAPEKETHIKSL